MPESKKIPFELMNKFHRFKLSKFPMPLPESELITLATIYEANQWESARENDDFRACGKAACIRPHDFQMSAKAGRERPDTKKQPDKRSPQYVRLPDSQRK